MDFSSPPVKPEVISKAPFDVQGFKNLLETLKESKAQKESKVNPLYQTPE